MTLICRRLKDTAGAPVRWTIRYGDVRQLRVGSKPLTPSSTRSLRRIWDTSRGATRLPESAKSGRVIEGVLFDLDGHCLTIEVPPKRRRQLADPFDLVIACEDFLVAWFSSEELHMAEYMRGECTFADQRCSPCHDVASLLGLDLSKVADSITGFSPVPGLRFCPPSFHCVQ